MRGSTLAWRQRARRPDSDLRQMIDAVVISREAVKKLKADFDGADSLTGLSSLPSPNDGVQLAETATTALDHSAVTAGQYATQLDKSQPSFQCARLLLGDTNSTQVEILSLTARLNPAQGGTQQVAFWHCQVVAVGEQPSISGFTQTRAAIIPLGDPLIVAAAVSEGDVVFSWAGKNPKLRPKNPPPLPGQTTPWGTLVPPTVVTYVFVWGTKADGTIAANCGWACETLASYNQNSDNLALVALTQTTATGSGFPGVPAPYPGSSWWTVVQSSTQTPRLKLVYNTGTVATITWSGANKPDLGATPTNLVEFIGQGEIPGGSSITYQVLADDTVTWVSFTDGKLNTELANVGKRQTYSVRATLNPSSTSDATPTLREIGVRELTRTDLSDVAEVTGGEASVDPIGLKCSIAQATLVALRDGDADYRDAITTLLANTAQRTIEFRVYRGCRALARGDWLLQRTFLLEDHRCPGPSLELALISPLALVRGQLPVYNVGTGLRIPLKYAGSTIAAAFADIRDGQLAVPARYRGPGPVDAALVGKTIPANAQAVISSYAMLKSSLVRNLLDQQSWQTVDGKLELDNLCYLAGDALIETQGRIGVARLCEGAVVGQTDSGTATSGAASTLTDTGKAWLTNQWANGKVTITGGTGSGQVATILSNTATVLTIDGPWTVNPNATSTYSIQGPLAFTLDPEAVAVVFPAEEIAWGTVTPGFSQAVPEFFVPWNWNQQAQRLDYEYRAFNGPALLSLSPGRIDAVQLCPTEVGQWITSDGVNVKGNPTSTLAQRTAVRHVTLFGGGLLLWDFITTQEWPELEEGDLIAVPTAHFVANNPISNAPISGWLMAIGKVVGTALDGRRFRFWIRRWNDLVPSNGLAIRQQFANPVVRSGAVYLAYDGSTKINLICQDAGSVKVAASKVSMPTDATVRAASPQVLTAFGTLTDFALGVTLNPAEVLYVKVFAYETAGGGGNESVAATAQLTAQYFGNSTPFNNQRSMLPVASPAMFSGYTSYNASANCPWIGMSWGAQTLSYPDGTSLSVPAASWTTAGPGGALPAAPTLTDAGAGTLAASTYYVRIAYVKAGMIVSIGAESNITIAVNHNIKVTAPPVPNPNWYDGWIALIGTAANTEWLGTAESNVSAPKAFGVDYTITAWGSFEGDVYSVVTTNLNNCILTTRDAAGGLLGASADYGPYPYFDATLAAAGYVMVGNKFKSGTPGYDQTGTNVQQKDGHVQLSLGWFKLVTTPASGGSGSGANKGGRY